jgi:1-deoxy-D-xylulose-5-phosphate reductoisomerase
MIPIFNSIFNNKINYSYNKKLDIDSINNLNLQKVDYDRFPAVKILKKITSKNSLYDTVIISANDELVDLFIQKKITFLDIHIILNKVINLKTFLRYKKIIPKSYKQILNLSQIVRLKTRSISIKYMNV